MKSTNTIFHRTNGKVEPTTEEIEPPNMEMDCELKVGSSTTPTKSDTSEYLRHARMTGITFQIRNREITGKAIRKLDIFEQNNNPYSNIYQRDLKAHTGCVNAVDFSPEEEFIVSGGDDLKVRLWKTVDCCTNRKPASSSIEMHHLHQSNIFALRFSHKTERIYSAGNDQRLLVHDIRTRERLRTYRASASIYHIATHPSDDNVIASASGDKNVYLFDLRGNEGDGLCTKLRQEGCAYSVSWNPQNHHLVAVCNEKTGLLVYDLRMDTKNYLEAGKITKRAICADWAPSGEALFCAISRSNPIYFDLKTSEHIQMRDPNYSNCCTIKSCTFAGQDYMLTGSDDWSIYVWKTPTIWPQQQDPAEEAVIERAFTVLKGHRSIVNHVKYGERSNLLLSCGVEKIVKCWSPLPLTESYSNVKPRDRLSNRRLFPLLADIYDGNGESDVEEDLSTLHRFDYYYEIQSLRQRHERQNGPAGSDSSDSDDDSEYGIIFLEGMDDGEAPDDDQESFFSDLPSHDTTPSSMRSPASHRSIPDEQDQQEETTDNGADAVDHGEEEMHSQIED